MLDRIRDVELRCREIERQLSSPEVFGDPEAIARLSREQKELAPVAACCRELLAAEKRIEEASSLLAEGESELAPLAEEELAAAEADRDRLNAELRLLMLPKDPDDRKNVIMEIRGGAGGAEAALFAAELYRMYGMYADRKGWRFEPVNRNETELGGLKEVSFLIEGEDAFAHLKYESGVHRVQRVPETESGGRIHTSTVTVAVLPEAEEVDVSIDPSELQIDTFRSSGAGGQHVNKTESAIRITHLPTGLVVECQDERSQYKNKDRAMKILRSRLLERARSEKDSEISAERRSQVGTGDRSERI
ncbi:MAG: peptide chain release factor 1, partial [Clostridia bacterium]|nr:peptide chain release factor 1 [Clostridia bacterium]